VLYATSKIAIYREWSSAALLQPQPQGPARATVVTLEKEKEEFPLQEEVDDLEETFDLSQDAFYHFQRFQKLLVVESGRYQL
jgi:hypothetical protein